MASERDTPDRGPTTPSQRTGYYADWGLFARRVAAVILIIALVFAVTLFAPVFQVLLVALLLALILSFPIRLLTRRTRLSYTWATAIVSIAYLVLSTLVLLLAVVPTMRFVSDLIGAAVPFIQGLASSLGTRLSEPGSTPSPPIGEAISSLEPVTTLLGGIAASVLAFIGGLVGSLVDLLGIVALASIVAITFLFEAPSILRSLMGTFAPDHRREIRILIASAYDTWKNYFRATIICGATIGAMTLVQLLLMGIPGAVLIGLFAAIISVVPIVGGFIALIPIALAPLLYGSTTLVMDRVTLAFLTVAINLVLQFFMWNGLDAIIVGKTVQISITLTIVLVAIGVEIGGMIGAYVAVPVAVIAGQLASYLMRKLRGGDPYPGVPEPHFVVADEPDADLSPPDERR